MGTILALNATSASFVYKDLGAYYNDGHYIGSVAKNITLGQGVSYWDGLNYRIMDPEISTGPVVFLPLAAALYAGLDEWTAFNTVPMLVNLFLFAWLLIRLPFTLPFKVFASFSIAAAIVSLSFQRWQWHLPLGEVPASLCLLLAISYFSDDKNRAERCRNLLKAGVFLCLAILSKMLVILTLPAFIWFIFTSRETIKNTLSFMTGMILIFFLYFLFCLLTMPQPNIIELIVIFVDYILFNFNFGITDWYIVRNENTTILSENIKGYLIYNWQNLPTIADTIGWYETFIILLSGSIAIIVNYCMRSDRAKTISVAFFSAVCLLTWYFLFGQHGSRYFFIPGYTFAWCLLLLSTLQPIYRTHIAVLLNTAIGLMFIASGRSLIFPPVTDFSQIQEMKDFSNYIDNQKIQNYLASRTIFYGYAEIAYYLNGNHYRMFPAYLDKEANLVAPASCVASSQIPPTPQSGLLRHPTVKCLINNPDTTMTFQWKNTDDGYFIEKIPEYDLGTYKHDCEIVLFQTKHYVVQQCSKATLSKIIQRETEGRIVIKDSKKSHPDQ